MRKDVNNIFMSGRRSGKSWVSYEIYWKRLLDELKKKWEIGKATELITGYFERFDDKIIIIWEDNPTE